MKVLTDFNLKELYSRDYPLWLETNISLIKEKSYQQVDWENLVEELEDMGRRHLDEAISRMVVILVHLYKIDNLRHFTKSGFEKGGHGWIKTIINQRRHLNALFKAYPSIKSKITDEVDRAWTLAIPYIIEEAENLGVQIDESTIPEKSPYSYEDIMERPMKTF